MEPKLNFIHVSENAFFSQEGKLSIIGIFDKIFSDNFPALHPAFAISLGMIGESGFHKIQIDVVSPQGQSIIPKIEKTIEIAQGGGGANFVANLVGLVFTESGKYVIKIAIDDKPADKNGYLTLEKSPHA